MWSNPALIPLAGGAIFAALMLVAAVSDVRARLIANWIPLAMLALGIARWCLPFDLGGLLGALGAGAIMLVVGFGLFSLGWIGGGDAKLMAAAMVWLGAEASPTFLVAMGLAGMVLAIGQVIGRRVTRTKDGARATLPYGVAIAAGAVAALPAALPALG